jgi:hypothetical protein
VATLDGFRPAGVVFQFGGEEGQAITRPHATLLQPSADIAFSPQAPDGGTHLMTCSQKLQDQMTADEAGTPGYQNGAHCRLVMDLCRVRIDPTGCAF